MYCAAELDGGNEYWSDLLLDRDWSMLSSLCLSNNGNTQGTVGSLMIPSIHLSN